jgi:hypothetical protein
MTRRGLVVRFSAAALAASAAGCGEEPLAESEISARLVPLREPEADERVEGEDR